MATLIHDFLYTAAHETPQAPALFFKDKTQDYAELARAVNDAASRYRSYGLEPGERVAVYLPKQLETVHALFGATVAGGVFVPVNPILKPPQVGHILRDCNVRILVTSSDRLKLLTTELANCHDLHSIMLVDERDVEPPAAHLQVLRWSEPVSPSYEPERRRIDADIAAILYTSGSTGRPKGVVLSHRNMVAGALSVTEYLENSADDRLLAVLPFSFDYGLSQLSTAFSVGASVVLMDYLLPRDVIRAVAKHRITGLAAVPPLWVQLADLDWPDECRLSLRCLTNSGGAMPTPVIDKLQAALPDTRIFLMYGLTEAFRSTYLPPEQLTQRPDSMGKAIPNAEVMVVRDDGSPCAPGEPGELVHRGALVSMGYWNDVEKTAKHFKPAPGQAKECPLTEIAVWSGDTVKMDEDGYLYFVGRRDEMIKTSGYRVSPTEVEEVVYASGLVAEAVALGIPHPQLGQAIVLVVIANQPDFEQAELIGYCKHSLPSFMQPSTIIEVDSLPRNPNGKIDRKALHQTHQNFHQANQHN